jgi:alpha-tubulin suppressor-like RCC1 family protein
VAVKTDGSLWTWGGNYYGQLGNGTTTYRNTPGRIGTDTNWKSVNIGAGCTMAIKNDGSIWGWGHNVSGQLGDGTKTQRNAPVRIGTDNDWNAINAGWHFTIALKNDGSIWGWGNNQVGQLCNDTTISHYPSPVRIGNGTDWKTAFGGSWRTMAIKNDDTLWAWGNIIGKDTASNTPVKITF